MSPTPRPRRALVALALIALYVPWGSTYFAIRVALEGFPPLLMPGPRFVVAAVSLFPMPRGLLAPAAEMMTGGILVLAVALARGERLEALPAGRAAWAWLYLMVFG